MRARGCSPYPELFSQPDESKRAEKMFELAIPSLGLDESKKADKLTLDLSPKLFNPDESKRAEKMLELALSQIFLGLDESKKADKPTLDLS
jgi:hypothetical protein